MTVTQTSPRFNSMALLVAYYQNPTVAVRNKITQLNTGLVRKIAHRLSDQCAEPYEDLEQIGCLGLIRAIERFNPQNGAAFSSFAVPYIRGEILHYLRDRSGTVKIPRRWQELQKQGQRVREKLAKVTGHQPSESEVAEGLGISAEEWQDIRQSGQNRSLLSLDATISYQGDSAITLGETLAGHECSISPELGRRSASATGGHERSRGKSTSGDRVCLLSGSISQRSQRTNWRQPHDRHPSNSARDSADGGAASTDRVG
jgi:RNA polymerase sigma-B factor